MNLATVSDAVGIKEKEVQKKAVKKKYALLGGKNPDAATRCRRALELFRPWGRKAQDYAHGKLEQVTKVMGAGMTRGTHPFDLAIGDNVIHPNYRYRRNEREFHEEKREK